MRKLTVTALLLILALGAGCRTPTQLPDDWEVRRPTLPTERL